MASICTLIRIFLREAYVCLLQPNWHHAAFCLSERRLGPPSPLRSPIIGPPWSLHCVRRRAIKDLSTCTHTSTSARFHLQRQTQADGGKAHTPCPPRPRFVPSAVFDADAQTEESTFARQNVQPSLTGPQWPDAEVKATPLSKGFSLSILCRKLWGGRKDGEGKKKFLLFWLLFSKNFCVCDLGQRGSVFQVSSADGKAAWERSITFLFSLSSWPTYVSDNLLALR